MRRPPRSGTPAGLRLPDLGVRMERPHLHDLPVFQLPAGYTLRWYRPSDPAHWLRIHRDSEGYRSLAPDLFAQQFGDDEEELSRRMAFVCRADGEPVATNTAWIDAAGRPRWGRVHWVATAAAEQGRGLARPLMTAVCRRLAELGHEAAYLTTNSRRLPALLLYHRFGFRPVGDTPEQAAAWRAVAAAARARGRDFPDP